MRNQLQKAASDVVTARTAGTLLAGDLEAKQALLETARQRYQAITRKLAAAEKEADKVRGTEAVVVAVVLLLLVCVCWGALRLCAVGSVPLEPSCIAVFVHIALCLVSV